MKKHLVLSLIFMSVLLLTACNKNTTIIKTIKTMNKITTQSMTTTTKKATDPVTTTKQIVEIEPEYYECPKAPVYKEIDKTGYTTYYFSTSGKDENDGLTEATPKQSINAFLQIANNSTGPTEVLFKKGDVFNQRISLTTYFSSEEKPFIISSYGESGYAKFTYNEKVSSIIEVKKDNIRISGLELYGTKCTGGIKFLGVNKGANKNIVVENCYIHDICFNWTSDEPIEEAAYHMDDFDVKSVCSNSDYAYSTCAIHFTATEGDKVNPIWYENIWIMNNTIRTIGRAGIIMDSRWQSGDGCGWGGVNKYINQENGWYPPKNVVISGNDIRYIGGDAIVPIGVEDCWIEHNTALHTALLGRYGYACAAIWPVCARRVYMQWNEAGYCRLVNGCTDGEGFDIDIGCSEIYFQYNYSHDNDGGGLLICNVHANMPLYDNNGFPVYNNNTGKQETFEDRGNWNNAYIRNNVFVNNGSNGSNPSLMVMSSDCYNIIIENNTIIMNADITSQLLFGSYDFGNCGRQKGLVFRNNIVYVADETYAKIDLANVEDYIFENNLYWNLPDSFFSKYTGVVDKSPIRDIDPMIEIPEERDGYDKINLFKAQNAEVYKIGMYIEKMNKFDSLDDSTIGIKYVGAFATK